MIETREQVLAKIIHEAVQEMWGIYAGVASTESRLNAHFIQAKDRVHEALASLVGEREGSDN